MAENETTIIEETTPVEAEVSAAPETAAPAASAAGAPGAPRGDGARSPAGRQGRGGRPERRGRPSSRGGRPERKSEFDQRIINIRRVARVMAGGRRFSFSVAIIIGNRKGKVGVGLGKAGDTTLAIDKAVRDAKKHMITLKLTEDSSIAHDVKAKYSASQVMLIPVKGRGLVAGSSVRGVLELGGVTNIVAKLHSGSKNGLNNARAAIKALSELKA